MTVQLCGSDGCRKVSGHGGHHHQHPTEAWAFMHDRDKKKLNKAGFATPRGGAKGAYQNHVSRSGKVIVPYEHFSEGSASIYQDGFVVRLFPQQYFDAPHTPKPEFLASNTPIVVGENAFVLYRTYGSFEALPPLPDWEVRGLVSSTGNPVSKRSSEVLDTGHYVLKLPAANAQSPQRNEGSPQGIFAPEYAPAELNYLPKCVLAWLTIHTFNSPYTTHQATHLRLILETENLLNDSVWEFNGVLRHGLTVCPLCSKFIRYGELHGMLNLSDEQSLANAGIQIEGATRSTVVNLFHIYPLMYGAIEHMPQNVAWGHSVCNTKLGQRRCYPLQELQNQGLKVGIVAEEGVNTFGWISHDWEMIRSPSGSVWVRLCGDTEELIANLSAPSEREEPPPLETSGVSDDDLEGNLESV